MFAQLKFAGAYRLRCFQRFFQEPALWIIAALSALSSAKVRLTCLYKLPKVFLQEMRPLKVMDLLEKLDAFRQNAY